MLLIVSTPNLIFILKKKTAPYISTHIVWATRRMWGCFGCSLASQFLLYACEGRHENEHSCMSLDCSSIPSLLNMLRDEGWDFFP